MFKKKFYGLLVIFLLVFCLGLSCTSYAYTFDDFVGYCQQAVNGTVSVNNNTKTACTYFLNNVNNIKNATNVDNYSNFILTYGTNIYFTMNGGCNVATVTSSSNNFTLNNIVQPLWSCRLFSSSFDTSYGNNPINSFTTDINFTIGLVNSHPNKGYFNSYTPPPRIYFTANHDHVVTQNNIDYNTLLRGFSVNQWKIGETTNFSDLDAFQFYFYDLVANVELGFVEGYREAGILRGTNCLYFSPPNMYVNSRYIRYNNPYRLDIYKYLDGVETTETYYYLFLPRNAVISNGVIISAGSGDFNTQDATNAIIDDISNTSNLSGDLASITSGDIYDKLGFQTYNTNWATFIWNMLLSLKDKLLLDNGPVTFTFPYMKTYITVSSSDFTVPNGLLKGFISTFLTFGLIVLIYQRITALYHRLEEGNVSEVLTWSDVDDETFLM